MNDAKLDAIILHYALKNKKYMMELSKTIKPEYFSSPVVKSFYNILLTNFANPKIRDVISVTAFVDYCTENKLTKNLEDYKNIYSKSLNLVLDANQPVENDFKYYLTKFKKRYNKLVVEQTAEEINKGINDGLDADLLNKIIVSSVRDINSINQIEVFDEGDIGSDALNMWEEYLAIESAPETYRGTLLGFPTLDERTNGVNGGELIIIAGMEGTGKSALMMNMGINAWLGKNSYENPGYSPSGHNVLYFSLEMPRSNRGQFTSGAYLNKRILSCVSELEFEKIRTGKLEDDEKERLGKVCSWIKEYSQQHKFYIVDIPRGATMADIETKYLEITDEIKIDLVIIDYIGIMAGAESDENDWQQQGNIAAEMHEFARIYNVPVMTAVQLNRPPGGTSSLTKANEKLNNTRVSRSAMITQNANIVLAIGCRDNEESFPDMPVIITKMRDGRKGPLTFTKRLNCMKIEDGSPISDMDDLHEFESFESAIDSYEE